MKSDYYKTAQETNVEFDARMDAEDLEASKIACPLESCGADVGERCCTESGVRRIRHARRLWLVRRENGN